MIKFLLLIKFFDVLVETNFFFRVVHLRSHIFVGGLFTDNFMCEFYLTFEKPKNFAISHLFCGSSDFRKIIVSMLRGFSYSLTVEKFFNCLL